MSSLEALEAYRTTLKPCLLTLMSSSKLQVTDVLVPAVQSPALHVMGVSDFAASRVVVTQTSNSSKGSEGRDILRTIHQTHRKGSAGILLCNYGDSKNNCETKMTASVWLSCCFLVRTEEKLFPCHNE